MANEKNNAQVSQQAENAAPSKEQFFVRYAKILWGTLIAVIVIGLAFLAYSRYVYQPAATEAQGQMFPAEDAFIAGNFETALNGDGNILGFADIINEYGNKAGKSVYLYAGVSALQLGQYEDALTYLRKYSGKDDILAARAKACEGDALVGLGEDNYAEAAKCFEAAAAKADNTFAAGYLLKAGITYEAIGNDAAALKCYKTIEDKYAQSIEGMEIRKYISRIESKEE